MGLQKVNLHLGAPNSVIPDGIWGDSTVKVCPISSTTSDSSIPRIEHEIRILQGN